ncbi:MAG: GlmU family protein [Cyclobacteriaceae bacterium]|nr:GlmU family protein [Cyclobacteriaceae bacterium]
MQVILFDDPAIRVHLLPFTYTRPVGAIRCGTLTIAEKWEKWLGTSVGFDTVPYLQGKFLPVAKTDNLFINGAVCPDETLVSAVMRLTPGERLVAQETVIAARTETPAWQASGPAITYQNNFTLIDRVWKIFQNNGLQLRSDFALITKGRKSAGIHDPHTRVYNESQIFVEEGAETLAAVLNANNGPIYLGPRSQVHEGALIRGPFSLGPDSHVNMGAKVRGDTTVGPSSKIGGEVSNAVLFGYSNKAHDGFLGNSVIGEWCNLGADTNTSNLKNSYDNIKIWSHAKGGFADSGLMFCGLFMGDHSKCGINVMFNTGTVMGVSANIFGPGYPRTFIPSFAWGGAHGYETYQLRKVFESSRKAMERRKVAFSAEDQQILTHIFEETAPSRVWEKNSTH